MRKENNPHSFFLVQQHGYQYPFIVLVEQYGTGISWKNDL